MKLNMTLREGELVIAFPDDARSLDAVRSLPYRRYDAATNSWIALYVRENWEALKIMGYSPRGIKAPEHSAYSVDRLKNGLLLRVPASPENIAGCRSLPDFRKWNEEQQLWMCSSTAANIKHILHHWPRAEWTEDAVTLRNKIVGKIEEAETARQKKAAKPAKITDYKFADPPPYDHQVQAFALARDLPAFAWFMEQRTGKSRVTVDNACYLFGRGKIQAALVVCPSSVKDPWDEEIEKMTPAYVKKNVVVWSAQMPKAEQQRLDDVLRGNIDETELQWLIINVDAFSSDRGLQVASKFLARYATLMAVDESSRIKANKAKRTKNIIKLGKMAEYRRILTGTPVTQGPLDLYTQFKFLDPDILGFSSFYSFRNHFAVMGGFNNKQVVAYANLEELQRLVGPYSYRVLRSECYDMPAKVYQKLIVEMTPEQRKAYSELKDEMVTEIGDGKVTVTMALTQMLRLQQIVGGFVPVETGDPDAPRFKTVPVPGENPKLSALLDFATDKSKMIIWARFRPEIEVIADALRKAYGKDSVVEFHGGISKAGRTEARKTFQDLDSDVRFFVGQQATGGLGITLSSADTVVYFSNDFSLELRKQSEDRSEAIGQTHNLNVIDIIMKGTVDTKVVRALRNKQNVANLITGDSWTEWL